MKIPVRVIVEAASAASCIDAKSITSHSRYSHFYRPRMAIYWIAREQGWSLPHIGRVMGGRDHSTVCHGLKRAKASITTDEVFAAFVDRVRRKAQDTDGVNSARQARRLLIPAIDGLPLSKGNAA